MKAHRYRPSRSGCALALASASCGSVVREGTGTSFLIVDALEAASGAEPDTFGGTLHSDVDHGRRRRADDVQRPRPRHVPARAEGSRRRGSPTAPTQNQFITIDRYHVRFIRADGRNTQGVDVPYGFDGAFTVTVGADTAPAAFTSCATSPSARRRSRRWRQPADHLRSSPRSRSTATTRPATKSARPRRISIDFGNFGDPTT